MKNHHPLLDAMRNINMHSIMKNLRISHKPNLKLVEARKRHAKVEELLDYVEQQSKKKKAG